MRVDEQSVLEPVERSEGVYHLVQDREAISEIFEREVPPEEYYQRLLEAVRNCKVRLMQ